MTGLPSIPNLPGGGGSRQQRAAQLKAEMESAAKKSPDARPEPTGKAQFHHVQEGETLESIAKQYGLAPRTIWEHPLNKQLRSRLAYKPERLARGDGLFIPGGEEGTGPVGQGERVVQEGECIASIAKDTGHFWETIWNDPANAELREVRVSPNMLLAGDRVTIPPLRQKQETGETEMRHRFVRRGEPSTIHLRFTDFEKPRAEAPYEFYVDGKLVQDGFLDANGQVEIPIPSNARKAVIHIYDEYGVADTYDLQLRRLPPITEMSGLQARLNNLGFPCGEGAKRFGPAIARALEAFQREYDLPTTGMPDEQTKAKILELHGS